jgi:DNA topoisomerase-1
LDQALFQVLMAGVPRHDKDFNEADHPRDADGKFGSGGTKASSLAETRAGPDGKSRVMADGSPLPDHVAALKLPPAWTDVRVSLDPKSPLQAVGVDGKGRSCYVYSKEASDQKAAEKFERVLALAEQFDAISAQNAEAQKSSVPRIKDSADCLDLIMKMGVRPGSDADTGAEKKAYGATTLRGSHVVVEGDAVVLRFVGKKGVNLSLPAKDRALAENLKARAAKAGPDGSLFPATSDKALLDYTHSLGDGSFKTKDFRTHLGTKTASEAVASMPVPKDEKSYKAAVKAVAVQVSAVLGNTPVIALQSYINPTVFAAWTANVYR